MKKRLRRDDFPAITSFVRGYFHEDLPLVHGSAHAAVDAFCAEANPDERRQLADEVDTLMRVSAGRPVRDLRRFITLELGSRWTPTSRRELMSIGERIRSQSSVH